jgi:phage N-6-adenine-methyltransferase
LTKAAGFTHDKKDNISVDWYTPEWIFTELGLKFDLDPASPEGGIPWIPVSRYYTEKDNGLAQPWKGKVWLNPPYGKHTINWLRRMHEHRNGIALVFARTDCKWFHDYVAKADAILFLKGRVKFVDGLGKTGGSGAGSGSMLIAWGKEHKAALEGMASKDFGLLVCP